MFRFSIGMIVLGIVAMMAMGGTLFFCWLPRSNPDKSILAGRVETAKPPIVYKSDAKQDGGPGPGVLPALPPMVIPVSVPTVQILFTKPEGMQVRWDATQPGTFDSAPLIVPGRQSFPQNAIYRLKITNLEKTPGMEFFPTIEIGPGTPRSEAFLAHNAIPVQFTDEDLDQVVAGNFVTKVIYLPDPEFQELALAGVDTLVSTRLDPGVDPIIEADRRGAILAIIRLGNKDLQLPGTGH